jgi:hypothetical protein
VTFQREIPILIADDRSAEWQIRKKVLGVTFSLMSLLTAVLAFGQQGSLPVPAKSSEGPSLCKIGSLPQDVQSRIKGKFGPWKVQEPADLSPRAHERWKSEKPLQCPGIAVGRFENAKTPSYAVLLVPQGHADAGYKFLVFSPKAGQPSYEMRAVDSGDNGAANFFIHRVRISKFFDEQSRKKFQVHTSEGILLVDSAEKEYETDVYFWAKGSYQHQPVDY